MGDGNVVDAQNADGLNHAMGNGRSNADADKTPPPTVVRGDSSAGPIRGFVNALAVFERRKELRDAFEGKKEGETQGLCIVVGTGKEARLGSWMKAPKGRNGAMVFEVPVLG